MLVADERTSAIAAKESADVAAIPAAMTKRFFNRMYGVALLTMASMLGASAHLQIVSLTADFARPSAGARRRSLGAALPHKHIHAKCRFISKLRRMRCADRQYAPAHGSQSVRARARTWLSMSCASIRRFAKYGAIERGRAALVLAAANRDPENAGEIFTFGLGSHACVSR